MTPEACTFDCLGLSLAGQRWQAGAPCRVLALHGWLDNAESFARLAPQLRGVDVVALDLAGHGWSSHRAAHASYLIWDDLREVLAVADALGWEQFAVLGHSRGAVVGTLLAAACPGRIQGLALIDGFWAMTCEASQMPAQLQRTMAASSHPTRPRVYASLEAMVRVRQRGALALPESAAWPIVTRNACQTDAGWQWRTDPRLQWPSLVMLTPEQQQAVHQAIRCPVHLVMASEGMGRSEAALRAALPALPQINCSVEAGGHHLHMEDAARILGITLSDFLGRL